MDSIKKSFEGILDQATYEDGRKALIYELSYINPNMDDTMFVRVQSWDETTQHLQINQFANKKVRITIEVID